MNVDQLIHKSFSLHVDKCHGVLKVSILVTAELHYARSIELE